MDAEGDSCYHATRFYFGSCVPHECGPFVSYVFFLCFFHVLEPEVFCGDPVVGKVLQKCHGSDRRHMPKRRCRVPAEFYLCESCRGMCSICLDTAKRDDTDVRCFQCYRLFHASCLDRLV